MQYFCLERGTGATRIQFLHKDNDVNVNLVAISSGIVNDLSFLYDSCVFRALIFGFEYIQRMHLLHPSACFFVIMSYIL